MPYILYHNAAKPEQNFLDKDHSGRRYSRPWNRAICLLAFLLVAATALLSALLWGPDIKPWRPNGLSHPKFNPSGSDDVNAEEATDTKRCGYSPSEGTASEATYRGCVYDFISGSWVYPECHDTELEAEFLAHQPPWRWWADQDMMREVSVDEIRATGGLNPTGYFVTPEYHDYHCAYTWRKLHRAMQGSGLIDEHVGGMRHTNHCSSTFYRDRTHEPQVAHFDLIFSGCMKL